MSNLIGKILGNRYRIDAHLKRENMGDLYKAYALKFERYVSLKVLGHQTKEDEAYWAQFEQVSRALKGLNHPSIAKFFDYDCEDGLCFIVFEYFESPTLADTLQSRKASGNRFTLPEISKIIDQLAQALDYAHDQGIIHLNLSPEKIIIEPDGQAILTDFGLPELPAVRTTQAGTVTAKATYISPEQARGEPADPRSDIYALDVMLYEMVTGTVPYEADTPVKLLLKHATEPVPAPSAVRPDIPADVEQVILKGMSKDPVDRFQSAGEMAAALQAAIGLSTTKGAPAIEVPMAPPSPAPEPAPVSSSPPASAQGKPNIFERTRQFVDKSLAALRNRSADLESTSEPLESQVAEDTVTSLRLDAAVSDQVTINRTFDLAVTIRQISSPLLDEADLPRVRSGQVQVSWPEDEPYIHLRLEVSAPECEIQGAGDYAFRLYSDHDSPIFYFHLIPKKLGEISIIVIVYQAEDWLGSTRVHTVAREQVVGEVNVEVTSQPVSAGQVDELESLRRQLVQHHSNLLKLQEQAAIFGAGQVPLHLLNQIEAEEQAIAEIEDKLTELEAEAREA